MSFEGARDELFSSQILLLVFRRWPFCLRSLSPFCTGQSAPVPAQRWTEAQAKAWYAAQPWPVGANFLPSTAINELEMWQADTFDPSHHRSRAGLGRRDRHEHDAGLPAQPALGAGSERVPAAHRYLPDHCRAAPHPARVCAVRLLLGAVPKVGPAAPADSRRAQLRAGCRRRAQLCLPTRRSIRSSKAM